LKLIKIGVAILINSHRIRFLPASGYPYKELFFTAAARLPTQPIDGGAPSGNLTFADLGRQ